MTEHLGAIIAAAIAALGAVGGLLVWLVRSFADRAQKADERTITVLQTAAKEHAVDVEKWRDTIASLSTTLQRTVDGGTATARTLEDVSRAMALTTARIDAILSAFQMRGASARSGQSPAVRPEEPRR